MPLVHLKKHYLVLPELFYLIIVWSHRYTVRNSHMKQYSIAKLRAKDPFIRSAISHLGNNCFFLFLKTLCNLQLSTFSPWASSLWGKKNK